MRSVYDSPVSYFACPVFNLSYICYSHFDLLLCYLNIHGSGHNGPLQCASSKSFYYQLS